MIIENGEKQNHIHIHKRWKFMPGVRKTLSSNDLSYQTGKGIKTRKQTDREIECDRIRQYNKIKRDRKKKKEKKDISN